MPKGFWPRMTGTTENVFHIGLEKGVLDFSALTSERLLKFPDSNGTTGQALTTNGSGILSWTTVPQGTVTSVGATSAFFSINIS